MHSLKDLAQVANTGPANSQSALPAPRIDRIRLSRSVEAKFRRKGPKARAQQRKAEQRSIRSVMGAGVDNDDYSLEEMD